MPATLAVAHVYLKTRSKMLNLIRREMAGDGGGRHAGEKEHAFSGCSCNIHKLFPAKRSRSALRTQPAVHEITRTRRAPGERAAAAVAVSNAALLAVATWRLVTPFTPPLSGFVLGTAPSTGVWSAAAVAALGARGGGWGLFLKVEAGITTWYKVDAQPMKPVGKREQVPLSQSCSCLRLRLPPCQAGRVCCAQHSP
jgi:hypothetical protein